MTHAKDVITTLLMAAPIACVTYVLLTLFAGLIAGENPSPFIPPILGASSGLGAFFAVDRFREARRQGNDS
ncbi:hypothetical protein D9M71_325220 [compost metagenome]